MLGSFAQSYPDPYIRKNRERLFSAKDVTRASKETNTLTGCLETAAGSSLRLLRGSAQTAHRVTQFSSTNISNSNKGKDIKSNSKFFNPKGDESPLALQQLANS